MRLALRVFVEVDAEEEAQLLCGTIGDAIGHIGIIQSQTIRPYRKIPEYFEIALTLEELLGDSPMTDALAILGAGWTPAGVECEIWNASAERNFIVSEARWASVEIIPAG